MVGDIANLAWRLKNGDTAAFTELYQETSGYIYWLARKIMRNEADAEDAVQETYMKIYKNIGALREPQAAQAWIESIARNTCLSALANRKLREAHDVDEEDGLEFVEETDESYLPEGYVDNLASREIVIGIIDALPEMQSRTVYLYYFSQLSVAEIAKEMDVSEGTVKSRLNAARGKIRQGVEEQEQKGIKLFAFPMLGTLLREDANACSVPSALSETIAEQITQLAAQTAPAAAAGLGTSGASGGAQSVVAAVKGLSTSAKILLVCLTGAAVVGGGILLTGGDKEVPPPVSQIETPQDTQPSDTQLVQAPTEPTPLEPKAAEDPDTASSFVPEEMLGKNISELIALYGEPVAVTDGGIWDCYSWDKPDIIANVEKGGTRIDDIVIYQDIPLAGVLPGNSVEAMEAAWSSFTLTSPPFPDASEAGVTVYTYDSAELTYQANVKNGAVYYVAVYPIGALG